MFTKNNTFRIRNKTKFDCGHILLTVNIYIYIYIYIYIVLFGPVKPELGLIPSGQENHSGAEHLNFPGRELNVIDFTEQYFFKEKTKDRLF